jgi:hypothetical protein
MTWETIPTQLGRGAAVTVSWRVVGGRGTPALAVSLSKAAAARLGLVKRAKGEPVQSVVVQRDRMAGKLRLFVADQSVPRLEKRSVAWKDAGCTVTVPLDDVHLKERKPAQDVPWEFADGDRFLVVKLPPWACPLVKVEMGRAA